MKIHIASNSHRNAFVAWIGFVLHCGQNIPMQISTLLSVVAALIVMVGGSVLARVEVLYSIGTITSHRKINNIVQF